MNSEFTTWLNNRLIRIHIDFELMCLTNCTYYLAYVLSTILYLHPYFKIFNYLCILHIMFSLIALSDIFFGKTYVLAIVLKAYLVAITMYWNIFIGYAWFIFRQSVVRLKLSCYSLCEILMIITSECLPVRTNSFYCYTILRNINIIPIGVFLWTIEHVYYTFKKLLFNKSYFVFMSDKNAADF